MTCVPVAARRGWYNSDAMMGVGRLFIVPVLFLAVVACVLASAGCGKDSGKPSTTFDAGAVDDFTNVSITYFEEQHLFLVRLQDGSFIAHYDLDPRNQLLAQMGDTEKLGCRVAWYGDFSDRVPDYPAEPLNIPGFEGGAFREGCGGSTFDALGRLVSGPSPSDLDPLPVSVEDGQVIVRLADRPCPELTYPSHATTRRCDPIR